MYTYILVGQGEIVNTRMYASGEKRCVPAPPGNRHREDHFEPQHIHMPGGTVTVSGSANNRMLEGSVAYVFRGEFFL